MIGNYNTYSHNNKNIWGEKFVVSTISSKLITRSHLAGYHAYYNTKGFP